LIVVLTHQLSDKFGQVLNEFLLYVDEMELIQAKRLYRVPKRECNLDLQQQALLLIDLI
jgi:hypothetical protein